MKTIQIKQIFISPEHGFIGREIQNAQSHQMESVEAVECVAGLGLKGDRFYAYKKNYKGQVTFFSEEALLRVFEHTGATRRPPWSMRRNIMLAGVDLNRLIGREFVIEGVRFFGTEECAPCRWMDRAIGEGARDFLKGQGGLRARILSDGILRKGDAKLEFDAAS